jgi:DNA-binding NarL/FixJ family response regulator
MLSSAGYAHARLTMSKPPPYVVSLIEDRASLWPTVERALPERAQVESRREQGCNIGLLCWVGATREEIAHLPRWRATHPGPLVTVLAQMPNALGGRAVAAQLDGAVLAAEIGRVLLPTLEAVSAGQCALPRSLRQIVHRPALSPRERQILAMIVLDFSNAEIARKLFVSESNVKNHLSSAFQKLGVKSRAAAAELILDRESGLGPGILRISAEESLPEIAAKRGPEPIRDRDSRAAAASTRPNR